MTANEPQIFRTMEEFEDAFFPTASTLKKDKSTDLEKIWRAAERETSVRLQAHSTP